MKYIVLDDSEEMEDEDVENIEDEGYRYYNGRGEGVMVVDDEDIEDDGD